MPLIVSDIFTSLDGTPQIGVTVAAFPTYTPLFVLTNGVWVETRYGSLQKPTDVNGAWSISLPWPSVCRPSTTKFQIRLPDGTIWQGTVPEGIAGPVNLVTLQDTYSWGLIAAGVGLTPVVAIVGPPGASGSNTDATTTTIGAVLIDQAPGSGHPIALTTPRLAAASGVASLDSGTHVPLAQLAGITNTQLSGSAGITSGNIASVDASTITAGTLPLARLSNLTTSQLSASAGILGSQLAASPTFSGEAAAGDFKPSGLTGATAASRYVGATASGAPVSGTFAVGDYVIDQTGKVYICTTLGTPGTWTLAGGAGTVSSVAMTVPGILSLAGSPITTSGTLAVTLATQTANQIFSGPSSGGAVVPTFRALVAADIAAVNPSALTGSGTVPLAGLAGITTTQLDAAAGILSGQIASLAATKITGTLTSGQIPADVNYIDVAQTITADRTYTGIVSMNTATTLPAVPPTSPTAALVSDSTASQVDAGSHLYAVAFGNAANQFAAIGPASASVTNDGTHTQNSITAIQTGPTGTTQRRVCRTKAGTTSPYFTLATIADNTTTTYTDKTQDSALGAAAPTWVLNNNSLQNSGPFTIHASKTPATANYGHLSIGGGPWDGSSTGKFVGSGSGTLYAGNAPSAFAGDLVSLQLAGATQFRVGYNGAGQCANNWTVQGALFVNGYIRNDAQTGTNILMPTGSTVGFVVRAADTASAVPWTIKGMASQSGDLQQWTNSTPTLLSGVRSDGLIYANRTTAANMSAIGTLQKAGTPADSDFAVAPPDGTIVVDSTGVKLWVRVSGAWKGVVVA